MKQTFRKTKTGLHKNCFIIPLLLMLFFQSCDKIDRLDNFQQVNLVANTASYGAARIDDQFINAWGFAFSPFGPAFIANYGSNTCVAYGPLGEERRSPIAIPGTGDASDGRPTGVVFNGTDNFLLSNFSPARFIYAGEDGIISGWNGGDIAEVIKNNDPDASYTGCAIGAEGGINFLYVANFRQSRIDVFDALFSEVSRPFTDPSLPAGYSPYNIQNIGNLLYVTYARVGAGQRVETGAGKGYVNIFNTNGSLARRFISGGKLNAPWGIVLASTSFWDFNLNSPTTMMVGNFGDGRINAYSQNGNYLGTIRNQAGPIQIPGLKGISFAPDSVLAEQGKLFFTAGPNNGQDGLFGYINNVQ